MKVETRVYPLTLDRLQEFMPYLLDIDAQTLGETWTDSNFSYDLPHKWDFSFFATCDDQKISGFVIASRKPGSIHIHRLAVAKNLQGMGIGKQLVEKIIRKTTNEKLNRITLKVSKYNTTAVSFYQKLGFLVFIDEGDNHYMELKLIQ